MKARSPGFRLAARVQTIRADLPRDRFAALVVEGICFKLLELLWLIEHPSRAARSQARPEA
jgi:hypothetical protein